MGKEEVPFGHITEDKIVLDSWGDHPERTIGEIKDGDAEASIQYFVDRFNELQQKVSTLQNRIETSENKGSFYMQLIHLRDSLSTHDGLGDYLSLQSILEKEINLLEDIIQKNRQKNTEIKKALLLELEEAVGLVSWNEATDKIKDIRMRWIKTGAPIEDEAEQIEATFQEQIQDFFDRRKAFFEDRARLSEHYETVYREIIEKAAKLENLRGKERYDAIDVLKREWKENGAVPAEIYQPLNNAFNKLIKPPRKQNRTSSVDFKTILEQIASGEVDDSQAKLLLKQLRTARAFDPESKKMRSEVYNKLNLVIERGFVEHLASKRFRNLQDKPIAEQKSLKSSLVRELIERDKRDLELISENLEKITSRDPAVLKMMQKKLHQQEQKISIKEALLLELKR